MVGYAVQSGKSTYRLNHFVVDTDAEMQEILEAGAESKYSIYSVMGSEILVIETGDKYVLNSSKIWVKQPSSSSSSGSSSSDDSDITVLNGSTDSSSADDDEITVL